MRNALLLLPFSWLLAEAAASAEPIAAPPPGVAATDGPRVGLALAINPPFRWLDGDAVAASVALGLTGHHAIRANFATYRYQADPLVDLIDIVVVGGASEASRHGRVLDLGLGWAYFPRRLWTGASLELGALVRAKDVGTYDSFAIPEGVDTESITLAGRGLVGWSWLFYGHFFASIAVGASVGYESGHETITPAEFEPMQTAEVGRIDVAGEGFLRLGVALDLQ